MIRLHTVGETRLKSAGARGDRGYLATASRRWHCVSNRQPWTSSFHYGACMELADAAERVLMRRETSSVNIEQQQQMHSVVRH